MRLLTALSDVTTDRVESPASLGIVCEVALNKKRSESFYPLAGSCVFLQQQQPERGEGGGAFIQLASLQCGSLTNSQTLSLNQVKPVPTHITPPPLLFLFFLNLGTVFRASHRGRRQKTI